MIISIPKETEQSETRVALTPSTAKILSKKHKLQIEIGAGLNSIFSDESYKLSGAEILSSNEIYNNCEIICKVISPTIDEANKFPIGSIYIGFLNPFNNKEILKIFVERKITSFAMEFIPRISRAQNMDALSSMATIAGYKAVLIALDKLPKMFPLMMTAAGTIAPATVLILGAGVAGLQAIATAKRMGAKVSAFDPRPSVKEQINSVGAVFVEMPIEENIETSGGYAKEQSDAFLLKEQEVIGAQLSKTNVVISTAQIFGKKAPILITKQMVEMMKPGSVIVDLAAEQGGNCELTIAGETVFHNGVQIIGPKNLPATLPIDASEMYSKNILNLINNIFAKDELDWEEEVTKGACITRSGEIFHPMIKERFNQ
ncbi:MAG: Re/Si-specific NAD(P)(+) transhydrogenase subunit alpha [Bacteroidota bacterium]